MLRSVFNFKGFGKPNRRRLEDITNVQIGEPVTVGEMIVGKDDIRVNPITGEISMNKNLEELVATSQFLTDELSNNRIEADILVQVLKNFYEDNQKTLPTNAQINQNIAKKLQITRGSLKEKYKLDKIGNIGKGAQGVVIKGQSKVNLLPVAIKMMDYGETKNPEKTRQAIEREAAYLQYCNGRSKNIVTIYDCYLDRYTSVFHIVLEMMNGGGLNSIIGPTLVWSEECIAYALQQVLQGLEFLHREYIVHRDIKSGNILYNTKGEIKLADFGFVQSLTAENQTRQSLKGSPYWIAPEICIKKKYDNRVDIWSLGVLGVEIADGRPPLYGTANNPLELMYKIATMPAPKLLSLHRVERSALVHHFLERVLIKDPKYRLSAKMLLMHPFLNICSKFNDIEEVFNDMADRFKLERAKRSERR